MEKIKTLLVCFFLLGCSTPQIKPGGTTIPQAIQHLQEDISHIGAIAVTNSSTWSEEQNKEFALSVRSMECQQGKADPVVVMLMGKVDMMLTGSYNVQGRFSIGTGSGFVPAVRASGAIDKGIGQGITLPLHFLSLSQLPNRVLLYHLKLIKETYWIAPVLNEKDYTTLAQSYWDNRQSLTDKIVQLESTWVPELCGKTLPQAKPLFGVSH
jgi:hypothetical protein